MTGPDVSSLADLEQRIRARGVRVDERLEILRAIAEDDAAAKLAARQEELLAAVRAAASKLKGTAG